MLRPLFMLRRPRQDAFSRLAMRACQGEGRRFEAEVTPEGSAAFSQRSDPNCLVPGEGSRGVAILRQSIKRSICFVTVSLGIDHLRSRKGTPADNGGHERMHRDMAMEVEAIAAASAEDQQRACDLWRADFNNCRPHESLGMKTPSQVYKPSATSYAGKKVDLLYPERMLVRTVSGRGFIKYRSTMIPVTEALAGYPVAIDPHSGPPHDLWFSHR